jgi:eukaryotic-like serine/threonine-protein kinase
MGTLTPERWRRIEEIYHAALARDVSQRPAFVNEACAADAELRREVEAMLAQGASAEGFVDRGAVAATPMVRETPGGTLSGRRIGVYQVLAPLGAGGMGEVYRAHDTKLGRDVAVKILPAEFTSHPDRLARFEREARILATLNHPHIGAIHGLEDSDGVLALVLELVEGETLADRIARAAPKGTGLPVKMALDIARQIADALDGAHEKGIVHRDLKPANIKITPEGIVKVLDFGLAKAASSDGVHPDLSQSPTITVGGTHEGMILGTAAYMSPEQARGLSTDRRTDIWAFGCVLYEMLTGRVAFAGQTVSDTIAAILEREPAWDALPATLPAGIDRLLRRCLEKGPTHRLRDAGDVLIEIDEAHAVRAEPASKKRAFPRGTASWAVPATAIIAVVIAFWSWINRPQQPVSDSSGTATRFTIQFPIEEPMIGAIGVGSQIALSPDGSQLAYVARAIQGVNHLYLRKIDQLESRRIAGTDEAFDPFFSADGEWIGFFAGQKLMKVALAGGLPQTIYDFGPSAAPSGASWTPDDSVVFAKAGAGLWKVSAAGGTPTAITTLKSNEVDHLWPDVLPGGKAVLFTAVTATGDPQIYAQSLETGERRALVRGVGPHFLPTGHVAYGLGGSLFVLPFDATRLDVAGEALKVVDNVFSKGGAPAGVAQAAFSHVGSLAFVSTTPPPVALVWVDRSGQERSLNVPTRSYFQPRLSPDEQRLAVMIGGAIGNTSADIWVWDFSHENLSRVTDDGNHNYLQWTPDGHRVSFLSQTGPVSSGGRGTISWKLVDNSNAAIETLLSGQPAGPPLSWSPDGRVLAFVNLHPVTRGDIWTVRVDEKSQPRPFLQTRFAEGSPTFSPDGRWLAYVSDESGRSEVYVQPFPGPGARIAISTGGGSEPVWPRRGHELFYRNGDSMMAVEVTTGPTFTAGKPRRLFDGRYARSTALWPNYDVTADGQRFLMVKGVEEFTFPTQINVVLNWDRELKRLVPTQ